MTHLQWTRLGATFNSMERVHVYLDGTTQYFPSQPMVARMTIEELRSRLREIADSRLKNPEADHGAADDLLIEFISDPEVTEAYNEIEKWCA